MRFGAIRFWRDAFRRQKIDYDWRLNSKIYVLRNASAALHHNYCVQPTSHNSNNTSRHIKKGTAAVARLNRSLDLNEAAVILKAT